jgi:hypothetical protein
LPVGADGTIEAPAGDVATVAPEVFDGEPPAPVAVPAQLAAPVAAPTSTVPAASGPGVWAVLIGIDDYPGRDHDLRSAVADAADMDAALARYGVPGSQRLRLADGAATAGNIVRSLQWLDDHAGPDDTAVFFYAGHVRKVHGNEALLGSDGGTVLDTTMADALRPLRARKTWLVIAGCFGGGFTEALGPGRILTAAAPADKLAYESSDLHRSYLVEYLVHRAMLEGNADASVETAFAWALGALRRDHPDRLPVQYDDVPGDLTLWAGGVVPPAPKPPPPPPPPKPTPPSTTSTTAPPSGQRCLLALGGPCRR